MKTNSAEKLLTEAYQSASIYLSNLLNALQRVSDLFRTGAEGEAIKLYLQFENGLNWIMQLIKNSINLVADHKSEVEAFYEQYEAILKDALEAWEAEDYVTLADVLEHELIAFLQNWNCFMISWNERVNK